MRVIEFENLAIVPAHIVSVQIEGPNENWRGWQVTVALVGGDRCVPYAHPGSGNGMTLDGTRWVHMTAEQVAKLDTEAENGARGVYAQIVEAVEVT